MTTSPYLTIITEQDGQKLVLRLHGELDVANMDSLCQVLDGLPERPSLTLVVDLARLSFADCGGLSALVGAHKRLAAQGGQLILMDAQPIVRRLLAVTGMDAFFGLSDPGSGKTIPAPRLPA